MGFAADAITDVITPPPRAERPNAAERDEGPSFAEHLDAHADAEEPARVKKQAEKPRIDQSEEHDASDEAVAAPPPQQEAALPLTAQLLAQLEGGPIAEQPAPQTKSAQTPDIAAPSAAPAKNGDCVAAPQAQPQQEQGGLLGLLGLNQQQQAQSQQQPTAEQTVQATTNVATPPPQTSKTKSGATKPAQPAAQAAATEASPAAPQHQAQTQVAPDAAAVAAEVQANSVPVDQAGAKSTSAQGVTLEAEPTRGVKARATKAEAPVDAPIAAANTQAKSTPVQQALAALRQGAAATNASDNGEVKIAPPAQSAAPQAAAAAAQAPAQASQATAEHAAQRIAPASTQVAREIVRRFNGGNTSFELRLDPPELGRIDVRLEVSRDHKVSAVIAADSPQALSDLVRHARELEASLQSAGLDLAENGLSFDLNQSGQGFADRGESNGSSSARQGAAPAEDPTPAPVARPLGLESWRGVRVDVTA